jgi:hypothetical protein
VQGDGKGDGGSAQQRQNVDQGVGRHLTREQRADQRNTLSQRQPAADQRQPAGQLIGREKTPEISVIGVMKSVK